MLRGKKLIRRIENYERYISKVKEFIKKDKDELNKVTKQMSIEEFTDFGIKTGYLDKKKK